jgi:hypothetical protein
VTSLFKKYFWRNFTCLSCSRVISVKLLPPICRRSVSFLAARGWWNLRVYLVSSALVLVLRFSKSVDVHFTIPKLKLVLQSHKYW